MACGPLVEWVFAQISYANILKRIEPLPNELKSLEKQSTRSAERTWRPWLPSWNGALSLTKRIMLCSSIKHNRLTRTFRPSRTSWTEILACWNCWPSRRSAGKRRVWHLAFGCLPSLVIFSSPLHFFFANSRYFDQPYNLWNSPSGKQFIFKFIL